MKNLAPLLKTFGVGVVAAYAFAVASSKFGPLPGIGQRVTVAK